MNDGNQTNSNANATTPNEQIAGGNDNKVKETTPDTNTTSSLDKAAGTSGSTGQETPASNVPAEQTPPAQPGSNAIRQTPEPLTVKNTLSSVHSDIQELMERVRSNGVMQLQDDLQRLIDALDEARLWVAGKLVVYDPGLARDLGVDTPKEPKTQENETRKAE